MKNFSILTALLLGVLILSGCTDNNTIIEDDAVSENVDVNVVENKQEKKASLILEDFDYINANLMPKSYHYEITNNVTNEFITEGDYEYSDDDHTVLEPPHVVNKEITSSELYEDVIYMTTIKYTLDDGQKMEITYYNDVDTLEYISALYIEGQRSTNYEFNY